MAFEVYCACSSALAAFWMIACHFDFNIIALVSLVSSIIFPLTMWYREWTGRQHMAATLLGISVIKVDLLGGPVQFLYSLDVLRRALRSGAYRRPGGLMWLFCRVRR